MKFPSICHLILFFTILFVLSSNLKAEDTLNSGLIVENYKSVRIVIADFSDKAKMIGLNEEVVRAKVELHLRRNGLTVSDNSAAEYLYVEINVVSHAFTTLISFDRSLLYNSGDIFYSVTAPGWQLISTGTHGNDSSFILNDLENKLDIFLAEYISDNEKTLFSSKDLDIKPIHNTLKGPPAVYP